MFPWFNISCILPPENKDLSGHLFLRLQNWNKCRLCRTKSFKESSSLISTPIISLTDCLNRPFISHWWWKSRVMCWRARGLPHTRLEGLDLNIDVLLKNCLKSTLFSSPGFRMKSCMESSHVVSSKNVLTFYCDL